MFLLGQLVLSAVGPQTYDEVAAGRIDLILCAEEVPPELENEIVFNLDFVCLVGARQRIKSSRVTLKQYLQLPHAMVLTGDGHQAMVDQPLKALGQKRHVALRIPFYIPAILAIAQTDLVLTAVSHQHRWIVVPGHDAELSCRRNLQYRRPAAAW
jgi:hypothetical protein